MAARPDDFLPGYVDPARGQQAPRSNAWQQVRAELVNLPGQIGRFADAAYTGLTHLPYDTVGLLDLANMGANALLPGDPLKQDLRSDLIQFMADKGLARPEPTGAGLPGYLFGGVWGPGASAKVARPAVQALNQLDLPAFKQGATSVRQAVRDVIPKGETTGIAHYANRQHPLLDPALAGTNPNLRGAEHARDPLAAVYGYNRAAPFTKEGALGNEVMYGKQRNMLRTDDPVYLQIAGDVDVRLKQEAVEAAAGRWAPSVDRSKRSSAIERAVRERGYFGTITKTPAGEVTKSFKPVKVTGRGRQVIPGEVTNQRLAQYIAGNPEGATISPQGVVPSEGIAVARPTREGAERTLESANVDDIARYIEENPTPPDQFIGSWANEGNTYLDNVNVNPQNQRLRSMLQGELRNQKALFDIGNMEEIPLWLRPMKEAEAARKAANREMNLAGKLGIQQQGKIGSEQKTRTTPSGLPALLQEDIGVLSAVPDVPQASLLRTVPKRGDPETIQRLYKPENVQRVKELVLKGQQMGGDAWYNTMPIRDEFVKELGEAEGAQRFNEFIDMVAVTSPRSKVDANIRRASYFQNQQRQGNPLDLSGAQPPAPYGHLAHKTQLAGLKPLAETGEIPLSNMKTAGFSENLKGNYAPLTADAHYVRALGLEKASGKPETGAPSATQYRGVEQFGREIANELGMTPAQMQANLWMGASEHTGVSNPQIFMAAFNDVVARTAKQRGISQQQALKDFITGKLPFLTVAGATVTGEMLTNGAGPGGDDMGLM